MAKHKKHGSIFDPGNGNGRANTKPSDDKTTSQDVKTAWVEGKGEKPPKTKDEAQADKRAAIKLLDRYAGVNKGAYPVSSKLVNCGLIRPCRSGACPVCLRSFQRSFVRAADRFLAEEGEKTVMVSIVSTKETFAEGSLPDGPFLGLNTRLEKACKKAGVLWAFGGFDISMNEHETKAFPPTWTPHGVMFAPASIQKKDKGFRKRFAKNDMTPRPVMIQNYDGNPAALAYAVKGSFVRRITLAKIESETEPTVRRNTRDRPLRVLQEVELLVALDKAGLRSRVFAHGVKCVGWGKKMRLVRA